MKTAISIPDEVFSQAECYAKNNGISRSQLFTIAVKQYVQSNQFNKITEKLNQVYSSPEDMDKQLIKLQTLSIEREEW